jgi:hypothetical protein
MWNYLFPGNGLGNVFVQFLLYGVCCLPFMALGLPGAVITIGGLVLRFSIVPLVMYLLDEEEE